MLVVVLPEGVKFSLTVGSIPENETIKVLTRNRFDQTLNEQMRRRRLRDTLAFPRRRGSVDWPAIGDTANSESLSEFNLGGVRLDALVHAA